ncbi:hypothetical protein QYE76_046209 [Lolium multiflorum]|uniref:Uncharacterized protein n=1 Tax=Lolium multiflorum TaxID=4521 RepID=A0AAD8TPJ1_LOLMU|nr:hypothetical protein QYE76_046209 [Lolium multiflorum]
MDVKLDMELDMKISHGRARKEAGGMRERKRRRPGPVRAGRTGPTPGCPVHTRSTDPDGHRSCDHKIVNQENKDSADIINWREFEALRNEMRREFRAQDEELKGTVDEIKQTLDATNATVTGLADQVTDIQRNIADMLIAIENLLHNNNNNKKMMKILSLKMTHTMLVVRLVVIVLVAGFHLAAMVVDKMKKMDWEFGDVFPEEVPAGLPPLRVLLLVYHRVSRGERASHEEEEQLDVKMDVKLDMELDMKISHGEGGKREECARRRSVRAGPAPGQAGPHTRAARLAPVDRA